MENKISLGFTKQQFEPGIHVCQIFGDDSERHDAIVDYIVSGLEANENTACFSEKESEESLSDFFSKHGLNYKENIESGNFSYSPTGEVYFEDGKFDPDRMVELLRRFYEKSQLENRTGARVIGEMTPDVQNIPGGNRLLEYESKVSMLLRTVHVNAVCQYDARLFDGATLLDILKVHPYMIIRGSVVRNPFFIQPETYLSNQNNQQI